MRRRIEAIRKPARFAPLAILLALFFANAMAAELVVLHADSLAGPMRALKSAFEAAHPGARPEVKFVRVTGEKDLATNRTIEFLKRATAEEGAGDLASKIAERAIADPAKPTSVPDVVNAVREGKADAGVAYYSAAVAARNDVDIVRFAASVNLSEAIRNAATVPGTARNATEATTFVAFLLSPEAQSILKDTGQPPVVPALRRGAVPAEIR